MPPRSVLHTVTITLRRRRGAGPAAKAFSLLVVCQGWEAVGRLRMSSGLDVERYAGSFFRRTASDMDFPALSSDHSFAIQLRHDGSLNTGRPVLLQYALVYSTASGHRRIRCACPLAFAACSTKSSRSSLSPAPGLCISHSPVHRRSWRRQVAIVSELVSLLLPVLTCLAS